MMKILLLGSLLTLISCTSSKRIRPIIHKKNSHELPTLVARDYIVEVLKAQTNTAMIGNILLLQTERLPVTQLELDINSKEKVKLKIETKKRVYLIETLEGKRTLCLFTFSPFITPSMVRKTAIRGAFFHSAASASRSLGVDIATVGDSVGNCNSQLNKSKDKWGIYLKSLYRKNLNFNFQQITCKPSLKQSSECAMKIPTHRRVNKSAIPICASMRTTLHFCELASASQNCIPKTKPIGYLTDATAFSKFYPFCNSTD